MGLVDDSVELKGTVRGGYSVLGNKDDLAGMSGAGIDGVIVALGDNYRRKLVYEEVERMEFRLISAIHPSAVIGSRVRIGAEVLVVAQAQNFPITTQQRATANQVAQSGVALSELRAQPRRIATPSSQATPCGPSRACS